MSKQPYQIGQKIFVVEHGACYQEKVPCPVCFSNLTVTLILGDGTHTPIECDFCGKGFEGPQGVVSRYKPHAEVVEREVAGMERDWDGTWKVQVGTTHPELCDIFTDRETAEAHRDKRFVEAEQQAQRMWESRFDSGKKAHGWKVGYHQQEIRSHERDIAWHKAKLRKRTMGKKNEYEGKRSL